MNECVGSIYSFCLTIYNIQSRIAGIEFPRKIYNTVCVELLVVSTTLYSLKFRIKNNRLLFATLYINLWNSLDR